ncbi:MAG: hypothetical protein CTY16_10535 [Methylobacter sp.]|nr:MAG: hypothetical protein CTY16_10535 [Methylobacter sp.]
MKPVVKVGFWALLGVGILIPVSIVYEEIWFEDGISALKIEDYKTALEKLRPLALLGDSNAQRELGEMYAFGWGVAKDKDLAMYWFRRAGRWTRSEPDKGASSAYYVGKNYAEGISIKRDTQEAMIWFRIAAEGGHKKPDR